MCQWRSETLVCEWGGRSKLCWCKHQLRETSDHAAARTSSMWDQSSYTCPPLTLQSGWLRGRATLGCGDAAAAAAAAAALHLPAQTHSTCRMQQQPPTASHTHAHKTHISAQSLPLTPAVTPRHSEGTKAFHSFYPQKYAESSERTGDYTSQVLTQQPCSLQNWTFCWFAQWGSPRRRGIVGKKQNKAVLEAHRVMVMTTACMILTIKTFLPTFERADLVLDRPSRIHAQRAPCSARVWALQGQLGGGTPRRRMWTSLC